MTSSLLIIVDDADQRDVLELYLSRTGYHVTVTSTADQALDVARVEGFEAVLLDQFLPDMDGMDLMPRLRLHVGGIPFVMMTYDYQINDRAKAAGAFACLLKPFRLNLVEAVVEEAIKRHESRLPQCAEEALPVTSIL